MPRLHWIRKVHFDGIQVTTAMISASVGKRPIGCLELTMSSALQLPVEFIEHEIAGVPSTLRLTSPFSITPAFSLALR
jgi:hypothetical protein